MPAEITYQGVVFELHSPSTWRLSSKAYDLRGEDVVITYLGSCGDWFLFHKRSDGNVLSRQFPTRDAALGLVVEAFTRGQACH